MSLDEQIRWLGREINALQDKKAAWADAKISALQQIQQTLLRLRGQEPINMLGK